MYEMFVNVIQSGAFALEEMLEKIDTLWIRGSLTQGQHQALIRQARSCAQAENSYAPVAAQLQALAERVAALEAKLKDQDAAPADPWPAFVQPTGAHDAYRAGDQVTFEGVRYLCVAPEGTAVVWSPKVYPAYWQEVQA